ncbi:hypothetical protein [Nocardia sp. NPDC004722]
MISLNYFANSTQESMLASASPALRAAVERQLTGTSRTQAFQAFIGE